VLLKQSQRHWLAVAGQLSCINSWLALTGLRPSDSENRSEARLESLRSLGERIRDCDAETGIVEGDGRSGCFFSGDERNPKSVFIARKQTRENKAGTEKKKV
jgi:hypothetical protein